jgi:hypothetical protein
MHKKKLQDLVEALVAKLAESNGFDPMVARAFIFQAISNASADLLANAVPVRASGGPTIAQSTGAVIAGV